MLADRLSKRLGRNSLCQRHARSSTLRVLADVTVTTR